MYILKAVNAIGSIYYYKCGINPKVFIERHKADELTGWEVVGEYSTLDALDNAMAELMGTSINRADEDKQGDMGESEVAGYELVPGIMDRKVRQLSKGHKESIARALRGKVKTEKHKKAIAVSMTGMTKTESHRLHLSMSMKGKKNRKGQ